MLRYDLTTPYADGLDLSAPLPDYPRPAFRREAWLSLNGQWDYSIVRDGAIDAPPCGKLTVPFPIESALSGVGRPLRRGEYLILSRGFALPHDYAGKRILLHIGAADQVAEVFCNGAPVGRHTGGYLPMTFDITSAVRDGENLLAVRIRDDGGYALPSGKQRKKRGGIWYTPVSGVWQTVWLEPLSPCAVTGMTVVPDPASGRVRISLSGDFRRVKLTVGLGGEELLSLSGEEKDETFAIPSDRVRLWSPEEPTLYDLTVETEDDRVESYFAFRSFSTDGRRFLLNGAPYFPNGVLDQGYFSDGIYTPASYAAYRDDILAMKELGYNTLRKHIKIEPQIFYYLCDKLGMLVFQDMVNVGRYSFFKDTILPFSGFRRGKPYVNVNKSQQKVFRDHALETQKLLYPHPSVVLYTIFNEGWGQFDGDGMYDLLSSADPTRLYDATSGWFSERRSDVQSEHIYFKPVRVRRRGGRPVLLSEFGGYSLALEGHRFNTGSTFGYRNYRDAESFAAAVDALYRDEILPAVREGLAGAIYTQLSDVEDECNGLLTYDRRIRKLPKEAFRARMEEIYAAFRAAGAGDSPENTRTK